MQHIISILLAGFHFGYNSIYSFNNCLYSSNWKYKSCLYLCNLAKLKFNLWQFNTCFHLWTVWIKLERGPPCSYYLPEVPGNLSWRITHYIDVIGRGDFGMTANYCISPSQNKYWTINNRHLNIIKMKTEFQYETSFICDAFIMKKRLPNVC